MVLKVREENGADGQVTRGASKNALCLQERVVISALRTVRMKCQWLCSAPCFLCCEVRIRIMIKLAVLTSCDGWVWGNNITWHWILQVWHKRNRIQENTGENPLLFESANGIWGFFFFNVRSNFVWPKGWTVVDYKIVPIFLFCKFIHPYHVVSWVSEKIHCPILVFV